MTTHTKILIGNLLLQLLYTGILSWLAASQFPTQGMAQAPFGSVADVFALWMAGAIFFHALFAFCMVGIHRSAWNSWLLSVLVVVLAGVPLCGGSAALVSHEAMWYRLEHPQPAEEAIP